MLTQMHSHASLCAQHAALGRGGCLRLSAPVTQEPQVKDNRVWEPCWRVDTTPSHCNVKWVAISWGLHLL